ncbi:hypothetical protein [Pedobacter africanus]|uniref:Uncharacterized protein n=1 Tax=Pedobacter africanus TaxID=151894 RepID=A0A1W1YLH1_9SPHI|nr:hypothetical protein [Pedobacter africanus]SMC36994.1 hypothetical protein SAMN04488524_0011 [Pedobacter africanus]
MKRAKEIKSTINETYEVKDRNYNHIARFSAFFMVLVLLSCQSPSGHQSQAASTSDTTKTTITRHDQEMSCDQFLSAIVKSSNAVALKHFSDTLVKVRLEYLTAEKARIKLYVLSDISEDPANKKLTENAVGWLEFHRQNKRLTDITNDPDKPLVLQYDTTLLQRYDLYKLCGAEAAIVKPGTGYEQRDVMQEADIRFNGKLKRFFTMAEFEKVFGKPDSIQMLKDEAPCITIFNTEAPDDKYVYKDGSRFETSKDRVAVDEFWFLNGNFITYKGIRIDANTTMNDIKQLFPTAVSGRLGMDKEGKLWVIQLREDHEGISYGHIKLFFENGKVTFMHWWFPC